MINMNTCGVYEIRNVATGKRYIGSSIHMERRLRDHRGSLRSGRHPNVHLQRAWDLSGPDAFLFSVLVILEKREQLDTEQRIIDGLAASGESLYNIAKSVTAPNIGVTASAETRAKMSADRVRRFSDPAARARNSESMKRALRVPGALKKMSLASTEVSARDGVNRRRSEAMKAYYATPGAREKTSASLVGRVFTDDRKNVLASASRHYASSEEGRAKRSAMMKARWADPEARSKIMEAKKMKKGN